MNKSQLRKVEQFRSLAFCMFVMLTLVDCDCSDAAECIFQHGFTIHHAQPGYVMMTKWLPTDEPNLLPGYASHYVGKFLATVLSVAEELGISLLT